MNGKELSYEQFKKYHLAKTIRAHGLFDYLKDKKREFENISEDLIQECDNEEDANKYFAKIEFINEMIEHFHLK